MGFERPENGQWQKTLSFSWWQKNNVFYGATLPTVFHKMALPQADFYVTRTLAKLPDTTKAR